MPDKKKNYKHVKIISFLFSAPESRLTYFKFTQN